MAYYRFDLYTAGSPFLSLEADVLQGVCALQGGSHFALVLTLLEPVQNSRDQMSQYLPWQPLRHQTRQVLYCVSSTRDTFIIILVVPSLQTFIPS